MTEQVSFLASENPMERLDDALRTLCESEKHTAAWKQASGVVSMAIAETVDRGNWSIGGAQADADDVERLAQTRIFRTIENWRGRQDGSSPPGGTNAQAYLDRAVSNVVIDEGRRKIREQYLMKNVSLQRKLDSVGIEVCGGELKPLDILSAIEKWLDGGNVRQKRIRVYTWANLFWLGLRYESQMQFSLKDLAQPTGSKYPIGIRRELRVLRSMVLEGNLREWPNGKRDPANLIAMFDVISLVEFDEDWCSHYDWSRMRRWEQRYSPLDTMRASIFAGDRGRVEGSVKDLSESGVAIEMTIDGGAVPIIDKEVEIELIPLRASPIKLMGTRVSDEMDNLARFTISREHTGKEYTRYLKSHCLELSMNEGH